ncbi:MAG: PHP domain-containing protein, partial [Planctomycetota bacterium]|nr:PHP domain-containing protein [Planctomycetota bacterium]
MICVRSWYSFLRGTASPTALVDRAKELGIRSLALTDDESLHGSVEFWKRCRSVGIHPVLGARVAGVLYLVQNRTGYGNLCRIITAHKKGETYFHPEGLLVSPAATRSATFSIPQEFRVHQLVSAIRENSLLAQVTNLDSSEAVLQPDDDPAATDRIARLCSWEFLPAPKIFPEFGGGGEELRQLCFEGLAWRYPRRPPFERLCRELDLIGKLGYADYFLVVRDIVRHSRDRGVPVAGRGSGASSVVAYVLGITNVCPIEFDLPFERFLHEGRSDYPDLDIDFCWRIRDDILDYVFHRFGDVAMVSSHITFQPRSAFREAAKAFGCSDAQVSQSKRRRVPLPNQSRIEAAAKALLGRPRHLSVHCGGVVLRPDGVAPMQPAEKGVMVTQYDKRSVEEVGLVKIDLLGNRALSTIRETIDVVEKTTGTRPDVECLPIDEPTVRLVQEGNTIGCNQLESPGMRALLRMMKPSNPKGLMKALALIRPGASSLGMKERFIRRTRGLEPSPPGEMLADTHGVMLYEDDAMVVASGLAGLSLSEGDLFRRKVKKIQSEEEGVALSREFLALCAANDTPPDVAADFWVQMTKFNSFSFCRAHAASYGVLAWASAWLAAHYPVAHWVGAINNNQGLYDIRVYIEQAKRE